MLIAVCVCITGCFGKKNDNSNSVQDLVQNNVNTAENQPEEEIEVYETFESSQGYSLEYNPNRLLPKESDGDDYFIALVSEGAKPDKFIEDQNIFYASSIIDAENVESVKNSVFSEENTGDCILAKGKLTGVFKEEKIEIDNSRFKKRTFMVSLKDGNAMLIETQFPNEYDNIWDKRFDHMLDTIVIK